MKSPMAKYWTADFSKFRSKVESIFGDIDKLAETNSDVYAHQVGSHGFIEYSGIKLLRPTKKLFLAWARKNKLKHVDLCWQAYKND